MRDRPADVAKQVRDAAHNARVVATFGRGGTFLDLGANVGEVAIRCAGQFRRVVAVESHPTTARRAARRVARAGLSEKVKVINAAVAPRTGDVYYASTPSRYALGSTARARKVRKRARYYHAVETISLRDLLRDTRARAVKMDIEGGEYECLTDFVFPRHVERLVVEFHWAYKHHDHIARIVRGIDATGLRSLDRGKLRRLKNGSWRRFASFVFARR